MKKITLIILAGLLMGSKSLSPKKVKFMNTYGCTFWKHLNKTYSEDVSDVILTQSVLESGWGTAKWVTKRNQLTAVYDLPEVYKARLIKSGKNIDKLKIFKSFNEYFDYKSGYYIRKKYDLSSKEKFVLGLKNYAEDTEYINKINKLYKNVKYLRRTICID